MKKLLVLMLGLAGIALTANADPTAKAVWNESTATLTFYYDENTYSGDGITQFDIAANCKQSWSSAMASITTVIFDESFKQFKPTTLASWFAQASNNTKLTRIVNLDFLDTSEATSMAKMFYRDHGLTSFDFSNFDTSKVTDMSEMFYYGGAASLDLSGFDTSSVMKFNGMFNYVSATCIYVSELFVVNPGATSPSMFASAKSIKGGSGTKFDSTKTDATYARIDNPPDSPGYFTYKSITLPPVIRTVSVSDISMESAKITVVCEDLKGGSVTIEILQDEVVVASVTILEPPLSATFSGLQSDTEYKVKVTAQNDYGSSMDDSLVFRTFAPAADFWLYDSEAHTVFWGGWTFGATVASGTTNVTISSAQQWPSAIAPLDFSLPVKDAEGRQYVITALNTQFGHNDDASGWRPKGYPQSAFVGLLTLPNDGVRSFGAGAFAGCVNATMAGTYVMPSSVTTIGDYAFTDLKCMTLAGDSLPPSVTSLGSYVFQGVRIDGDLILTNITSVAMAAFKNTNVGCVRFGPDLRTISGGTERGAFLGCTRLTNVVFDAEARVSISDVSCFCGCTSLCEIDLHGVKTLKLSEGSSNKPSYSHFAECSSLTNIIFDSCLTTLSTNAIAGANLVSVVFEGVPPTSFEVPFLSTYASTRTVKTYVHKKLVNEKNEEGMGWADYAANGRIGAARKNPANNTTWAAEFVAKGIDLAKRPLLTIEPSTGLMLLVR